MNVLVTGADGFLGAVTVEALLAAGHVVGALVLPNAALRRLEAVAQRAGEGGERLRLLRGDMDDCADLHSLFVEFRPDACLHFAWYAEPGQYLHSPRNISLLDSSLALIQMLTEIGCRHFVGVGTCAEYDSMRGWMREDGPTRPETLYAASKLSLCLCGEQIARLGGMTFAWARVFYPYGPGEDARRMIPALIGALLSGQAFPASSGEQVRDYIHVADIAQAFLMLLTHRAEGIYNIGSGEPVSIRLLMQTIESIIESLIGPTGRVQFGALPPRDWEPRFLCADVGKLRALGWQPRYDLQSGLTATIAWWRAQNQAFQQEDSTA